MRRRTRPAPFRFPGGQVPQARMGTATQKILRTVVRTPPKPRIGYESPFVAVNISFDTLAGNADAAGGTSSFTGDATFTTVVGAATADAGSTTFTGDATFDTLTGAATADGGVTSLTGDGLFDTLTGAATADGGVSTFTGDAAAAPFDYGNGPGTWRPIVHREPDQPTVDAVFATIAARLIAEGGVSTFTGTTAPPLTADVQAHNAHALLALLEVAR